MLLYKRVHPQFTRLHSLNSKHIMVEEHLIITSNLFKLLVVQLFLSP
jgi:hypothetical protein